LTPNPAQVILIPNAIDLYGKIRVPELRLDWQAHIHGTSHKALPEVPKHEHKES